MIGGIPAIYWGLNNENVLQFGYPLDSVIAGRRPREGSEFVQGASGIEDAWITGYDYELTANWRWIPSVNTVAPAATAWSGPTGVQAFLDYARAKNTFRFVPDSTVPLFYVDGCYISDPMDTHGSLESDGTRNFLMTIRNPLVDFHQALRGIMFEYVPGASLTDPVLATFTRATAARRRGVPGTLAAAVGASDASGVLRDRHYEGSQRTTLLEAARTQLVTDPENFGNWTVEGTPVLTAGQADPFGGTAAYLINDDDGAVLERIKQTVTFTADATKAISVFAKAGTSGFSRFGIFDVTAAAWRQQVTATWTAGVPALATTLGAGTLFPVEAWGNGWYRLSAAPASVVAANTNVFYVGPTNGQAGSETGTTLFFGANAWNATFPSSYQGPGLTTRNTDTLTYPFLYAPQPMFLLIDEIESGEYLHPTSGTLTDVYVGNGASGVNAVGIYRSGAPSDLRPAVRYDGASAVVGSGCPALVKGDRIVSLALLSLTGTIQGVWSLNGAADVVGAASGSGGALPAAWNAQTLGIGIRPDGGNPGFLNVVRVKIGPLTFGGVTRNTIAAAQSA